MSPSRNQVPGAGTSLLARATASAGPWTQVGASIPNSATPGATDTGLTAAQEYWYQLRSTDSIPSSTGLASTLHVAAAPATPTANGHQHDDGTEFVYIN